MSTNFKVLAALAVLIFFVAWCSEANKDNGTITEPVSIETQIKNQFSAYDGHHNDLQARIKKQMNDPASYEHVETRYEVKDGVLNVCTKFRGKNGFGALVLNTVCAQYTTGGEFIKMVE